jgi:AcrR family transcriptional regulator
MAAAPDVTPNRRGARSREIVLDAAERLMAEQGYEAATVSSLVKESGIPLSSVYHYFGSKDGVLLAVMERGAERFFRELPEVTGRIGRRPIDHLRAVATPTVAALDRHPDFLRLLIVMATQPSEAGNGEVRAVVTRVRDVALDRLRQNMDFAFGLDPSGPDADRLARFALAAIDGAFVAAQADPRVRLSELLQHLPAALVALRRELS